MVKFRTSLIIAWTSGFALLYIPGCSTSRPTPTASKTSMDSPILESPEGPARKTPAKEISELTEIKNTYNAGDFQDAIKQMVIFEKRHPRSVQLYQVQNLHGLALLLLKNNIDAITHFKKAIELTGPNPRFTQYIYYNLATAQYQSNLLNDAQQSLEKIHLDSLDRDNRIKAHYLRARVYLKKDLGLEASREALGASRLFGSLHFNETKEARGFFAPILEKALVQVKSVPSLEALYKEFEDSPLADLLLFHMAKEEINIGNTGSGEVHLRALMTRFPDSVYYAQASELIHTSQASTAMDANALGVLLPLKGKFARFGANNLQSIELALRVFDTRDNGSKITLVVEDSGEEPDQAIKALDRLVMKHHVAAIIGPLLSKGIDQVTQRAEELGVPLISLARFSGMPGDYIFQAGLSLQLQAREIARFAIEKLGLKRFAMIYPKDKSGESASQYFWDAVDSMGGQVVGAESYSPNETDFRQVVDKLSGLYYQDARQRELDELEKERDANHIKKRTRKTEQFFALKPIVDYEAIFIPDDPKVAGQIFPTFAYRDVDKVKFLGTSSWNSPEFVARTQGYANRASFVDAFFPNSVTSNVRRFVESYRATFGQEPTALDAIAYDAASLTESVLSEGIASRSELRDRLKSVKNFTGVTGYLTYQDGQFERNLRVLTVQSGKIAEISN